MSDYAVVGIESLLIGAVNTTSYAMPGTFTTIEHIVPDSAKLVFENPEPTQIMTEESDDVFIELANSAKKTFEFATYDIGDKMLLLAFGGSTNSTLWMSPTTATVTIERAIQMTSKTVNGKKHIFKIPHASIRAGGELKFSKTDAGQLTFSGSVLKAGTASPMTRTLS
jgi:hypothetical protein